jgi:membrane-associated phospholipid phosphatase
MHISIGSQLRRTAVRDLWPIPSARAMVFVLGFVLPLLIFATLAEDVWAREKMTWDAAINSVLRAYVTPYRDQFMIVITQLGAPLAVLLIVACVGIALLGRRQLRDALFVVGATVGATALIPPAKLLFERARPVLDHLPLPAPGYAFPSGHATVSMALGAALIMLAWRTSWRWLVLILATLIVFLIGLSRVYLGVHYASDVLAGWCIGLSWAIGVRLFLFDLRRERWETGTDRSNALRREGGRD